MSITLSSTKSNAKVKELEFLTYTWQLCKCPIIVLIDMHKAVIPLCNLVYYQRITVLHRWHHSRKMKPYNDHPTDFHCIVVPSVMI